MFVEPVKQFFRKNENLKAANAKEFVTKEEMEKRVREIIKCSNDILYFANNYVTIVSPGIGKHIIKLYLKQAELIQLMVNEDRVICTSARQSGKCVTKSTYIIIRNKNTQNTQNIQIEEFDKIIRKNNCVNLIDQSYVSKYDKFIESIQIDEYEVLTDTGFVEVKCLYKTIPFKVFEIQLSSNNTLRCADTHILFNEKYEEIFVKDLHLGDQIVTESGLEEVRQILDLQYEENMYDLELKKESNHRYYTNGILSHNTTAYNIVALWYTIFNQDKKVLICANRQKTAIDIVGRLRLCYEYLPHWMKPGIVSWNKGSISFSNRSSIESDSTSEQSGRGGSFNMLLLDEFSFVEKDEDFWTSVYPVISSAKGTKVIIVSTPNGTGNLFYDIWNKALLGIDKEGWKPFMINWWDKPGRDEEWKKKQIASFNGDMRLFNTAFGNVFEGSAMTLIDAIILNKFRNSVKDISIPVEDKIDKLESFKLNVWKKSIKEHTYIIGADVAEGVGGDYSVILVFDCTDLTNIEIVASFASNAISTSEFGFLIPKVGRMYNDALVCVECNSIGKAVVDAMVNNYDYDNILTFGSKDPTKVAIYSHQSIKNFACLWIKDLMNMEEVKIVLNEKQLIYEMEWFEKKRGSLKSGFAAVSGKHDDYMMSFVWAMLALNPTLVENYFTVDKYFTTKYGKVMPARLRSTAHTQMSEYSDGFDGLADPFTEDGEKLAKLIRSHVSSDENSSMIRSEKQMKDEDEDGGGLGFFSDGTNDKFDHDSGDSWR